MWSNSQVVRQNWWFEPESDDLNHFEFTESATSIRLLPEDAECFSMAISFVPS